jgi:hypothetical protein
MRLWAVKECKNEQSRCSECARAVKEGQNKDAWGAINIAHMRKLIIQNALCAVKEYYSLPQK